MSEAPAPESVCRLGVLAFGDSITNGGGELQWGVALQSWALWTARGLGLPFTCFATDGARAADMVGTQIPAFERARRGRLARYDLGCLYIGVNDVRVPDWKPERYAAEYDTALSFLGEHCDHVLALTAPLDLARPRAGTKVAEMNAIVERLARRHGAICVDLHDFGARNQVMADHVHPTAFGQIAIAQRALDALTATGLEVVVQPAALIAFEITRWQRLRGDLTYAYRHAKVSGRALVVRGRAGAR